MSKRTVSGAVEVLDEQPTYTIHEICEEGVRAEFVVELVDYGVIAPVAEGPREHWVFDSAARARLHRAQRLQRDMELNLAGIAMSLEVLDEVQQLRQRVDLLQ